MKITGRKLGKMGLLLFIVGLIAIFVSDVFWYLYYEYLFDLTMPLIFVVLYQMLSLIIVTCYQLYVLLLVL